MRRRDSVPLARRSSQAHAGEGGGDQLGDCSVSMSGSVQSRIACGRVM